MLMKVDHFLLMTLTLPLEEASPLLLVALQVYLAEVSGVVLRTFIQHVPLILVMT